MRACPIEEAIRRIWCVDMHGLLTNDMGDRLLDYQATYARPAAEVKSWRSEGAGGGSPAPLAWPK